MFWFVYRQTLFVLCFDIFFLTLRPATEEVYDGHES